MTSQPITSQPKKLRIAFMGTPDFSVPALKALAQAHEVVCVYTQPPRPKGRGQKMQLSPVHACAEALDIPVHHPQSLKKKAAQEMFTAHNLDVAIVAAYGLILPKAVLEAPRYGCLNIHASLLPRWRGASPIQRAIWAGDKESGNTIMQMDRGLDTGAMIAKRTIELTPQTTASTLHDALSILGATMIEETLRQLAQEGQLSAEAQPEEGVTYAALLTKDDGRVNWAQSAIEIDRQVRGLTPWPAVWCLKDETRLKILKVEPTDHKTDEKQGMIIDRKGLISCGSGQVLRLLNIQPAGKKAMDFASAINGGYIKVGDILS